MISRGPKDGKKGKNLLQNVCKHTYTYTVYPTFPYNISQNVIGYGVFRKHLSLSKTQTCENIELTVSKIVTHFSPSWPPFSFSSMGLVDPSVENSGKNTVTLYNVQLSGKE